MKCCEYGPCGSFCCGRSLSFVLTFWVKFFNHKFPFFGLSPFRDWNSIRALLHIQFYCPILQTGAILTWIIVSKNCLFCLRQKKIISKTIILLKIWRYLFFEIAMKNNLSRIILVQIASDLKIGKSNWMCK